MKERSILFSTPMINAIRKRWKGQTRRICPGARELSRAQDWPVERCPYGGPGDRLLVKEGAWYWCYKIPNGTTPKGRPKFRYEPAVMGRHVVYCADGGAKPTAAISPEPDTVWRFKPGRFMPRWAVRIVLEIDAVRVERLQAITEKDAIAEGVDGGCCNCGHASRALGCACGDPQPDHRDAFIFLWESIHGPGSWNKDPYVYAISFTPITLPKE